MIKIAIIGSGSSYTPLFVDHVIDKLDVFPVGKISFYDISEANAGATFHFMCNLLRESGKNLDLELSGTLEEALQGADFVLTQIRVGGFEARKKDILLGLRHNLIGQETTGIGGFAKALRTIPEIIRIAELMKKYSNSNAWLINFTNPAGIITEAVLRHTETNVVGICNCSISMIEDISILLRIPADQLFYNYVGANHLAGIVRLEHQGVDVLDRAIELLAESELGNMKNVPDFEIPSSIMKENGYIPVSYLKYFWFTEEIVAILKSRKKTRADELIELDKKVKAYYRETKSAQIPSEMSLRGGAGYNKLAFLVVSALAGFGEQRISVLGDNNKALTAFDKHMVLELPSIVRKNSVTPEKIGEIPLPLRKIVQEVKRYESLTVSAAINRKKETAYKAMENHPLIRDTEGLEVLFERLLDCNKKYIGTWS